MSGGMSRGREEKGYKWNIFCRMALLAGAIRRVWEESNRFIRGTRVGAVPATELHATHSPSSNSWHFVVYRPMIISRNTSMKKRREEYIYIYKISNINHN